MIEVDTKVDTKNGGYHDYLVNTLDVGHVGQYLPAGATIPEESSGSGTDVEDKFDEDDDEDSSVTSPAIEFDVETMSMTDSVDPTDGKNSLADVFAVGNLQTEVQTIATYSA